MRFANTLFGRIFFWFCLILICGQAANALVFSIINSHFNVENHPQAKNMFSLQGRMLLSVYENEGAGALEELFEGAGERAPGPPGPMGPGPRDGLSWIFDSEGNKVLGGPLPSEWTEDVFSRVKGLLAEQGELDGCVSLSPFMVCSRTMENGETVYCALEFPKPPPPLTILLSGPFWTRLIPVLLCTLVLSFILARLLTRPIRELRRAARRIAGGDLRHRIGSGVGQGYEEINALSKDFDTMASKVEHLVNSQRQLLRDISHELRSPLTRMNVAIELARNRTGDMAKAELDRVELDAARLDELITQMLTFIRLDHMQEDPQTAHLNIGALLMSIVRDTDVESQVKGVNVVVKTGEPIFVNAAPELLRRALENVLRNAIHYTPQGKRIDVRLVREELAGGPQALIDITDMGPGVPDEALDKLFLPYYRVESCRERRAGGTGIGLAIAERSIRLHGGTIEASNAPGGGLRMRIRIPATG